MGLDRFHHQFTNATGSVGVEMRIIFATGGNGGAFNRGNLHESFLDNSGPDVSRRCTALPEWTQADYGLS